MKNAALVLSGGGARGCAHIGAINALEQNGFKITSIAGTSIGALVGGIYATGQLRTFEEWICSLDIRELLKLTDFSFNRQGFVKGNKVFRKLKEMIPQRNIEDLPLPYCAIATDIIEGTEIVFTQGDLFEAIRASVSIPTVFQPHKMAGRYLVDGGLLNPLPVNRVARTAADILTVIDANAFIPYEKKKGEEKRTSEGKYSRIVRKITDRLSTRLLSEDQNKITIFNLTYKSIGTMMHKISELTLEKNPPDLLVKISIESFNFFDFHKAREIIAEGEKSTLEALKNFHR